MENIPLAYPVSDVAYVHNYQFSGLEGRLLTLIESFGLQKTQEDAAKSLIRREVWGFWDECYTIPKQLMEEIYKSTEVVQNRNRFQPLGIQGVQTAPKKKIRK